MSAHYSIAQEIGKQRAEQIANEFSASRRNRERRKGRRLFRRAAQQSGTDRRHYGLAG